MIPNLFSRMSDQRPKLRLQLDHCVMITIMITDDHQMAELLNSFFAFVFTEEKYDNLPAVQKIFSGTDSDKLCSYQFNPEMVTSKLNKLKMNKASGMDSVGTRMLIELSQ